MKKRVSLHSLLRSPRSNAARALCALMTMAGLIFSSNPRSAAAMASVSSKRTATVAATQTALDGEAIDRATIQKSYGALPLSFEANRGQTDRRVRFLARGDGYQLFLSPQEAVFSFRSPSSGRGDTTARDGKAQVKSRSQNSVLHMTLENSAPSPKISGEQELQGKSHYYSGKDQRKWIRDVPSYAKVRYEGVYPGVDAVYYGHAQELEYDFVVAPKADPDQITLAFKGADEITLDDEAGDLVLQVGERRLTQTAPFIYQEANGVRHAVEGSYVLKGKGRVGFRVGDYDRELPLVIDPVAKIGFSTFLGGARDENARGVAVDSAGNAVVAGFTESVDFPAQNADPDDNADGSDAFVTKLNATGTGTLYSVYIGGRRNDGAEAVAVDPAGNAYVTGTTSSPDFPITRGVVDERGSFPSPLPSVFPDDCFVTKLNTGGGIVYSTFLAGHDQDIGFGIAVDATGRAYVTGLTGSENFPVKNEFQNHSIFNGSSEVFVSVLSSNATGFIYSSYFGGDDDDCGFAIALDSANNAYITGFTDSDGSFPVKSPSQAGPFQASFAGRSDAFVAKLNPFAKANASLVYSTFVGGGGTDEGLAIAVDDLNQAHVTGLTGSFDFPLVAAPGTEILDRENIINEAFVLSVSADGSALNFSTFFGGEGQDAGRGIRVDAERNIYITGNTTSATEFPISQAFQPNFGGGDFSEGFVAKLAPNASKILYSSYLGGRDSDVGHAIAIDAQGNAYVAGDTISDDFPITPLAFQRNRAGSGDAFLTRINQQVNPDTIGVFDTAANRFDLRNSNDAGPPDITQAFGQTGDLPVKGDWDGDGTDTIGVFRPSTAQFFLNNQNTDPNAEIIINRFGQVGDLPIAGDWDGDGDDEVGVFRAGTFILRANTDVRSSTITFAFGNSGDTPLAGDWNGDGKDTIGVFNPLSAEVSLRNSNSAGAPDIAPFFFGLVNTRAFAGDWDGDGVDTIGNFNEAANLITLRNSNTNDDGVGNIVINGFGQAGDLPLGGDWDGQP